MAQSTVKLIVDAQNAIKPLQRVNEQTKALSSSTDKLKGRLDRSNTSLRNTGKAAKIASGGVRTLVGALKPLLAAFAVIGTARFILFQTAQLETQTKALESLTKSAEKAQAIVQEIKAFGSVTPFKSSELIETTKLLKAFGFETEDVVDMTKRVADIAGTAGADIDRVAFAIGKVQAKNKFMQEENMMLLEKGVNIQKELQQVTGLTGDELAKAMRKGEVGADKFVEAIKIATSEGGQFFEGAVNQSGTLAGKFSTLVDNIETLSQEIGEKLKPVLKSTLDLAIDLVTNINQAIAAGSISDVDKKALKKQAEAVVKEQTNFLERAAGGIPVVEIEFMGEIFKGQASQVQSEITNALINAEVAKRLKKQLDIQKKLTIETEKTNQETEKTTKSYTELISTTDLFNESFNTTDGLINEIGLGTDVFSLKIQNATVETDKLKNKFDEIGQSVEQNLVESLTDAVMGAKSLGDALTNVLKNLQRQLVQIAIQNAVSGLGGFVSNVLGSAFGGTKAAPLVTDTALGVGGSKFLEIAPSLKFANGGNPPVGRASLVGEKGPELFVPRTAGTIIPNSALGGGGVTNMVTVNVDASGTSVQGNNSDANQFGEALASAIKQELVNQQRSGGLLSRS